MTEILSVFVHGEPKAQPRPRAFARKMGNKYVARVYTEGTAEAWKSAIASEVKPYLPNKPIEGPVKADMFFFMPRPKYLCQKKNIHEYFAHTTAPDIDNLMKAVFDCMTQIGFWKNDKQITWVAAAKYYSTANENPGMQLKVSTIK